jgi:ribosomal protein L29
MRVMNKEELQEKISAHKKWLLNEEGGQRADLSGAKHINTFGPTP